MSKDIDDLISAKSKKERKLMADTICFTLNNPNRAYLIMHTIRSKDR